MIGFLLSATLQWGPYTVSWQEYESGEMPEETPVFTIAKGGNPLRSFEVWNAEAETLDVDGDGTAELLVCDFSGGAHCCFTYYLYTRKPALNLLGAFDMGNAGLTFQDIEGDGVAEAIGYYDGFAYYEGLSYVGSPFIPIVFSLKAGKYVENTKAFPGIIQESLDEYLANPPWDCDEECNSWVIALYAHMVLLGKEASAWETIKGACPKALDWLSENAPNLRAILAYMDYRVKYTEEGNGGDD